MHDSAYNFNNNVLSQHEFYEVENKMISSHLLRFPNANFKQNKWLLLPNNHILINN